MKRYNLTVVLHANVAVNATSAGAAWRGIEETLAGAIELADMPDLVAVSTEVTGIYDKDWNEVDVSVKD